MMALIQIARRLGRDRRGISSIEYAMLLAFIGGGIVLAATNLGTAVSEELDNAATCIEGTQNPCSF